MHRRTAAPIVGLSLALIVSAAFAGPREDLLGRYAAAVKTSDPAFAGFSAARGETLHRTKFGGGKPDTPACASCHSEDPRRTGQTPAGKPIDPVALSASPSRYADEAKVEKWFKRNCNEVLGRPCSALEKGDWLTYMLSR